ncbi:MAG TPA: glycosyltransferase family 2 protein, partial [Candidatus Saccharimonadales bacterium]|nr:glycosyltransferase family 2 protein [Candidatus Saccharimonadales bacterium]
MTFALISLAVLSALEVLVWWPPLWRLRRWLLCGLIPLLALFSGLLFGEHLAVWSALIMSLSVYRLINLLRLLENRSPAERLYSVTRRTCYLLIAGQLAVGAVALLSRHYHVSASDWAYALGAVQLAGGLVLLASTRRHLRTTLPPLKLKSLSDHDLPTLSVLIPARNETDELEACLQSLVSSNYPKLEILVLDDCSQNKHTPAIIKDYAHAGIRFIAGEAPPKRWLAKNYAYQQLVEEANGEVLLFCGVDTRFQPNSLRAMVEVMQAKRKYMLSWIPRNLSPRRWRLQPLLVQPARYAWELSLPRRLFKRPPVLSTCWLITAEELRHAGGFAATMNSVSVESFFAKHAIGHDDGYAFLQSNANIGLVSAKSLAEQRATA